MGMGRVCLATLVALPTSEVAIATRRTRRPRQGLLQLLLPPPEQAKAALCRSSWAKSVTGVRRGWMSTMVKGTRRPNVQRRPTLRGARTRSKKGKRGPLRSLRLGQQHPWLGFERSVRPPLLLAPLDTVFNKEGFVACRPPVRVGVRSGQRNP
jgi:hypothetical protein